MTPRIRIRRLRAPHRQRRHPACHSSRLVRHHAIQRVRPRSGQPDFCVTSVRRSADLRAVQIPLIGILRRLTRGGNLHIKARGSVRRLHHRNVRRVRAVQHRQFIRLAAPPCNKTLAHITPHIPLSAACASSFHRRLPPCRSACSCQSHPSGRYPLRGCAHRAPASLRIPSISCAAPFRKGFRNLNCRLWHCCAKSSFRLISCGSLTAAPLCPPGTRFPPSTLPFSSVAVILLATPITSPPSKSAEYPPQARRHSSAP